MHRGVVLLLIALPGMATPGLAAAQPRLGSPPAGIRCSGDRVVWLDTQTQVYHFAGNSYFGTTPQGAFMCEHDAVGSGARPGISDQQNGLGW